MRGETSLPKSQHCLQNGRAWIRRGKHFRKATGSRGLGRAAGQCFTAKAIFPAADDRQSILP